MRHRGNQDWAATKGLQGGDVDLFIVKSNSGVRKLHHKLMIIDGQLIIAGSFNYTDPANRLNDENLLVIGDLEATDGDEITKQSQLAQYAVDEVERIIADFGELAPA